MVKKLLILAVLCIAGGLTAVTAFYYQQAGISRVAVTKPAAKNKSVAANISQSTSRGALSGSAISGSTSSKQNNSPAFSRPASTTPVSEYKYPEKLISKTEFSVGNNLYPIRQYKALLTASDPAATQWWTTQTGLPKAWDYGTGVNTKIAVIDTGFALSHEEFTGRWLDNPGEAGPTNKEAPSRLNCSDQHIPLDKACNNIDNDHDGIISNETGPATVENPSWFNCTDRHIPIDKSCNGLDNDGNGFISDFRGWDFNSGDWSVQAGETNPDGTAVSHGSAVAGTAAANGNNSRGIAGVSWGAKILPLQALGDNGVGDTLTIARAIRYAADRGVDVINLSLGSSQEDTYLRQAIDYALSKGAIVVAAAGNDGCDCVAYPGNYPEVIAVGASSSDGTVAKFSSYGDNLSIVAPGSDMQLPGWTKLAPTNSYVPHYSGTSFAAPYISGLLANARANQPTASWGQLVSILLQTADHKTLTQASPHSNALGFGFVRADDYMARVSTPYSQATRYSFQTETSNTLGAPTGYGCDTNQFPTAPFYEVKRDTATFYSVSNLTAFNEAGKGSIVTKKGYVCVGLPTDQVTFPRLINPSLEFSNANIK